MDGPELITVGQLARRVGLTTKALRHYDRVGLLTPAEVDPGTGYRLYRAEQVEPARLVHLLRSVDVPLDQVRLCLAAPDDREAIERVLVKHRQRLQARLDRVRSDLHRTDHLIQDGATAAMTEHDAQHPADTPQDERRLAVDLFNGVWRLLEQEDRGPEDDDRMLHMAHASRHHWGRVGTPVNLSRGEWQCSRVYAVLGRAEPALHHARRGLELCQAHGTGDWDLAYAFESLARAHAVAGDREQARAWTEEALAAAEEIAQPEDRELLLSDLESIPGQPRFW
ncbi:MerR family transcriptional regulator [Kitasatospora viridis]|uniref:DNA-binding transcriptional MerR regulator n=1 Tax=Kitasatospora viridis TaxID=281105 RepID=A0A561SDL0_9ACTN|nr:MerR family transcriptional regulator [Kitasatospora viridis]TWF72930.1 DNA-binding transcriptional MerR regulator [Kitasatospora viridis]